MTFGRTTSCGHTCITTSSVEVIPPLRRSLGLDLLRAAARGVAGAEDLKLCLALAPAEQSMYLVLLHHCRHTGTLRVSAPSSLV